MGFYGNITNTSRTTFVFDKIYSSRTQMDSETSTDGIYAGRYVLVNYELDMSEDTYQNTCYCYENEEGQPIFYSQINFCEEDSVVENGVNASSAISSLPISYATGAASTNGVKYTHFNYTGPQVDKKLTATNTKNNALYKINIGNHVSPKNINFVEYIKLTDVTAITKLKYEFVTKIDYDNYWAKELAENSGKEYHAHIINDIVYLPDATWAKQDAVFIIPKGYRYTANENMELWAAKVEDGALTWSQINIAQSTFLTNFEKDKAVYGVSRGYDSTVWQKLYSEGTEKYVMIAELNTVVPTFGVSADAPTLVPIAPHFDTDSTNVYYKLHWQPSWGFRIKGSNPNLTGPSIGANGAFLTTGRNKMRDNVLDAKYYPSDYSVEWKSNFYNSDTDMFTTKYYNSKTGAWDAVSSKDTQIDAAIYYNADGFDRDTIAYSKDLITEHDENDKTESQYTKRYNSYIADSKWTNDNRIAVTPTGLSGNTYSNHQTTADTSAKVDTQELEIMLPVMGDTVAHLWDLAYGGRETNDTIKTTNTRNTDISWEDGKTVAQRKGLRLVTDENGVYYRPKNTETIAGCINTAHDILGMIIASSDIDFIKDENNYEYQENGSVLLKNDAVLDTYSDDKIYFNKKTNEYYRRHLTYDYNELANNDYEYVPVDYDLDASLFTANVYYVKNGSTWQPALDFVAGTQYYMRTLKPTTIYTKVEGKVDETTGQTSEGFTKYEPNKYWFQDYSGNPVINNSNKDQLSDYIMYKEYQKGRKYYTIEPREYSLAGKYEKNKYFQLINGVYSLDTNEEPYSRSKGRYYTIDTEKVENITDFDFDGIYVPNIYYYYVEPTEDQILRDKDGNIRYDAANHPMGGQYLQDSKLYPTPDRVYYRLTPSKSTQDKYFIETIYTKVDVPDPDEFSSGLYYIDQKGTKATGVFNAKGTYYLKVTSYRPAKEDDDILYNIDLSVPLRNLLQFYDDTYYTKVLNNDGECIGYKIEDRQSIIDTMTEYYEGTLKQAVDYYVFGYRKVVSTSYTVYSIVDANNKPYKDALQAQSTFYEQNKYHYSVLDGEYAGSYILDDSESITEDRKYYTLNKITPVSDFAVFYDPYEYYVTVGDGSDLQFVPAGDAQPEEGVTYYRKNGIYVKSDDTKAYALGTEWNVSATQVPASVTLSTRTERYELVPLVGFARNLNTLHGMLLKINQTLESNDRLTRQSNNIAGVMNQLNDILSRFSNLCSRELVIVDDYGRIRSSNFITQQTSTSLSGTKTKLTSTQNGYEATYRKGVGKDIYPQVNEINQMENQWITLNVNGHINNPLITLHHNYQTVKDTTTESDKNIALTRSAAKNTAANFDNNTVNNTLKLYTPIIDKTGHVVGKNTETVHLPFGFKTIKTNNSTDEVYWSHTNTASAKSSGETVYDIVADNVKDDLTIQAGNKWIRFQTDATGNDKDTNSKTTADGNNVLTLAHETHVPVVSNLTAVDLNTNASNTIVLQENKFDKAGHMTHSQNRTYTLPYGFKFLETDGVTTDTADLYTTLNAGSTSVAPSDTKITPPASSTAAQADNTQDTLNINPANKWIQVQLTDDNNTDVLNLAHEIHSVNITTANSTNMNTASGNAANQIVLHDMVFDAAGHITENHAHTYTLPYGFKTVKVENSTAVTDAPSSINSNGQIADSTQDTITITSTNKWIKLDNNTEDTIKIGHEVHFTNDEEKSLYGLAADTSITDLDTDNTFEVPYFGFDAAGHITSAATHTVTLPESFSTITVGDASTAVSNLSHVAGNVEADTLTDTLTINSGNKWISIAANSDSDTITMGHIVNEIDTTSQEEIDLNVDVQTDVSDDKNLLNIPVWAYDEAGHIIKKQSQNYRLPYGFKHITLSSNLTEDDEENIVDIVNNEEVISADNAQDCLTIVRGNKWIKAASADNKLTLGHAVNTIEALEVENISDATFGGTITIPDIINDEAGHITAIGSHTVNIPDISLVESELETEDAVKGNVLIDLTYNDGVFTKAFNHLSELSLNNYESQEEDEENQLFTSDSTVSDLVHALESAAATIKQMEIRIKALEDMITYNEDDNTINITLPEPATTDNESDLNNDTDEEGATNP